MTSAGPSPRVLLFGNLKGGVGKTTHCVHVAAALGRQGNRCLVWDLDANQGATQHLGVDGDEWLGTTDVLTGRERPLDVVLTPEDGIELPENVHLLPASRRLERVAIEPGRPVPPLPVDALEDRYDYVLLDTAPNLTAPTTAGYRRADAFILTVFPDPLGLRALAKALETLRTSRQAGTVPGRLLGVLLGNMPGSRHTKRTPGLEGGLLDYLEEKLGRREGSGLLFSTILSRSVAVPRAQMMGRTLFQTDPKHRVVRQYRKLAAEIEARLEARA